MFLAIDFPAKFRAFLNAIEKEAFQKLIIKGLTNTVVIAILGLLIGTVIGIIVAIIKARPNKNKFLKVIDYIFDIYVAIFRGSPIVVQLLIAYYVILPMFSITNVEALTIAYIIFGLNSGAYVSEIMRGGLKSVDYGQLEAGYSIGLTYQKTMLKIVVPQAFKNILPTMGNELISLIKETSVVSFISVVDLYTAFNTIGTNTYSVVVPYIIMALIYIGLVVIISIIIKSLERIFAKNDRN